MTFTNADLSKFQRAKEWRLERARSLFASDASWEWFKRLHRHELITSGALIVRSGRAGDLVHVERIDSVIQRILESESLKRIRIPVSE